MTTSTTEAIPATTDKKPKQQQQQQQQKDTQSQSIPPVTAASQQHESAAQLSAISITTNAILPLDKDTTTPVGTKGPPATMSSSTSAATFSLTRKRPYRRTKKPKGYCDKSTVTTTTDAAMTPVNVYDAVLGEAEDLLTAAKEAQALGRLKMASAYQLLSHARLVGLGKRFDRAHVLPPEPSCADPPTGDNNNMDMSPESHLKPAAATVTVTSTPKSEGDDFSDKQERLEGGNNDDEESDTTDGDKKQQQQQQQQNPVNALARLLPSNIELDTIMMEHLARAAVELHHQRTGRKISADGLLASPMNGFLAAAMQPSPNLQTAINEAKSNNAKNTAITTTNNNNNTSISSKATTTTTTTAQSVAWTEEEKSKLQKALQQQKTHDPEEIAKLVGSRTEAQVKAYLRNNSERKKGTAAVEQDFGGDEEGEDETPRKRGGRGRKPPTTAMNTVPNAKLNARFLLQGKALE